MLFLEVDFYFLIGDISGYPESDSNANIKLNSCLLNLSNLICDFW